MAAERLVLDASYALEAILPSSEKWRREALEMIAAIAAHDVEAHVPWVFFAELANVVTRSVRGRRVDDRAAADFLREIDVLSLRVDPAELGSLALHQAAMTWHAGAYDAIYLDLAARLAVPIATRDRGIVTAAHAFGVPVHRADAIERP